MTCRHKKRSGRVKPAGHAKHHGGGGHHHAHKGRSGSTKVRHRKPRTHRPC